MSVASLLAELEPKPSSYLAIARRLGELTDRDALVPLRVFALSTFTFDLVVPYLVVEAARRGIDANIQVGPFGQLEQQVLDPGGMLAAFAPQVVTIATRIEELAPELVDGFLSTSPDDAIDAYVARVTGLARSIRERYAARVVVWNQPVVQRLAAGFADPGLELSQQHAIAELDRRLAAGCLAMPGVVVFDVARVANEVGTRQWFDPKLRSLARMPLTGAAQIAVAARLARTLRALVCPAAKCLVLDLDNTLWGGVLGEDGVTGIALGEDHPGSAYKAFQRIVRSYRDRGILLAIASKNNPTDVQELFTSHRDMLLGPADFAATQIHWNDKATSLRAIADELSIGIDSLVFFDDSPVERAWVRAQLPEVTVIEVPTDPLRYGDALDDSGVFDQLVLTSEDRKRAELYRGESQRKELERAVSSVDDFLRGLEMTVTIGLIDRSSVPRVVQLLGKTNQFNVTTRRHGEPELEEMISQDGTIALWMRVADRYGDSGLVGVAIAVLEREGYRLDSFLMSCRVLGRRVEHALLWSVARRARDRADSLLGEFIPTRKNAPAAGFFADTGFAPIADRANWWRLDLATVERPHLVEIIEDS